MVAGAPVCNAASIGIELVNLGYRDTPQGAVWFDYPPEQIDAVIELVKKRKGSAHAPKHIKFVAELPMTGVGKVDKKVLKAGFWIGRERMVG